MEESDGGGRGNSSRDSQLTLRLRHLFPPARFTEKTEKEQERFVNPAGKGRDTLFAVCSRRIQSRSSLIYEATIERVIISRR